VLFAVNELECAKASNKSEQYSEGHPLSCCCMTTSASDIAEMNVIIKAEDVDVH
jgi:hypothetical protein